MTTASKSMQLFAGLVLLLIAVSWPQLARAGGRHRSRGWRNLKQFAELRECNREFSDQQSKWLQAQLVVAARWLPSDEQPSRQGTHRFNVTVTVISVLKSSSGQVSLRAGSRITVGEFSGALAKRQEAAQKQLCTPARLGDGRSGYIFFLTPTSDPAYFRHSFLPVKRNSGNLKKFSRVRCTHANNCPSAPRLIKATPKGVRSNNRTREISMRFVCRAHGKPLPTVRWLKDGAELIYSSRLRAQFKRRSHSIVSRLIVKPVEISDAGNYTCQFSNVNGSVNASFEIRVATILNSKQRHMMTTESSVLQNAYMCNTDLTHCLNGGSCVIDGPGGKQKCWCPPGYLGDVCEKIDTSETK